MNKPASAAQLNYIHILYTQDERDQIKKTYKIQTLNDLNRIQASELIDAKKEKYAETDR